MSEIRLLKRMPENHYDDFIDFMVMRFLRNLEEAINAEMFNDLCKQNDYMFTEPSVFRKKFIVWCVTSQFRQQITALDLRSTNRSTNKRKSNMRPKDIKKQKSLKSPAERDYASSKRTRSNHKNDLSRS